LRLLDEGMQQDEMALSNTEDHTAYPVLRQLAPHLSEATAKRPAQRHADRPTKLDRGNVCADNAPVVAWQRFEPIPDRLRPAMKAIEGCGKALQNRWPSVTIDAVYRIRCNTVK
jgi:hypothetical protein